MDTNNIQETLLSAMEIIASQTAKDVVKDKDDTEWNCTIIDDSKRKNGEYRVTNGSIKFTAYSSDTSYKKDEHVAVIIPKGNYENTKYILYRVSANGEPLSYTSPLNDYVQMTENLINNFSSISLNQSQKEVLVSSIELTQTLTPKNSTKNTIFNILGFECSFQTFLKAYPNVNGSYGIKIYLTYKKSGYETNTELLVLDSSEFFGDPYNFTLPSKQQKAFSLSRSEDLQKIEIRLYQKLTGIPEGISIPLITLSDIKVGFGCDLSKITDNTLDIYTLDSLEYNAEDSVNNIKRIGLTWYNKDEYDNYLGFSDGIFDPEYDEEEYLTEKNSVGALDAELDKEIPKTINGVQASSYVTVIEVAAANILTEVDKTLPPIIRNMNRELAGAVSNIKINDTLTAQEFLSNLVSSDSTKTESLSNYYETIKQESAALIDRFRVQLKAQAGYTLTSEEENKKEDDTLTLDNLLNSLNSIKEKIYRSTENIEYVIGEDVKDVIESTYGGYKGIYDSYNSKINKILEKILNQISKIQEIKDKNLNNLINNSALSSIYTPSFKEEDYENRYCIYWYRYTPGYSSLKDTIMGDDWERLEDYNNFGIPSFSDGKGYNTAIKGASESITFNYEPRFDKPEEKIIAILYFNHKQYKSEPLVLKRVVGDNSIMDQYGTLSIEHGIQSKDSYTTYGEDNFLMNTSESRLNRELKLSFSSEIGQTFNDFDGGVIYWYIPKNTTMLLATENNSYGFSDSAETIGPEHYREGYDCYSKDISKNGAETIDIDNYKFLYKIKDFYVENNNNNTIYCKIVKETWTFEAEKSFVFSSHGVSGTEYTFVVKPSGEQKALTANSSLVLDIKLYNYNNEEIPLYMITPSNASGLFGTSLVYSWKKADDNINNPICQTNIDENTGQITGCTITYDAQEDKICCGILELQATVRFNQMNENDTKTVKITSSYPVAFCSQENNVYIEGPTKITYSSMGTEPKYYNFPYRYYNNNGELSNVQWYLFNSSSGNSSFPEVETDTWRLIPKVSYIPTETFPIVCAGTSLDALYWYQPIIINQQSYSFGLVNQWDGKLQINEDGGYILSNMLVAGTKNNQNQFTGVMLGDVNLSEGDIIQSGMFGFQNGVASFGFRTDGTAFLGKAGSGRIIFDGNESVIKSAGYDNGTGISIDLDAPSMIIKKENVDCLKFDSNGLAIEIPEMKVETDNLIIDSSQSLIQLKSNIIDEAGNKIKDLLYASPERFELMSVDWSLIHGDPNDSTKVTDFTGSKIDLVNSEIYISNANFKGNIFLRQKTEGVNAQEAYGITFGEGGAKLIPSFGYSGSIQTDGIRANVEGFFIYPLESSSAASNMIAQFSEPNIILKVEDKDEENIKGEISIYNSSSSQGLYFEDIQSRLISTKKPLLILSNEIRLGTSSDSPDIIIADAKLKMKSQLISQKEDPTGYNNENNEIRINQEKLQAHCYYMTGSGTDEDPLLSKEEGFSWDTMTFGENTSTYGLQFFNDEYGSIAISRGDIWFKEGDAWTSLKGILANKADRKLNENK